MNRPRLTQALRITWTAFCGIVAVLLAVLWMQSYSSMQIWHFSRTHAAIAAEGTIMFDGAWEKTNQEAPYNPGTYIETWDHEPHYIYDRVGGLDIQFWVSVVVVTIVGILPWLPSRFSVRTLLIAITLIAVILGLMAWLKHKGPALTAECTPSRLSFVLNT